MGTTMASGIRRLVPVLGTAFGLLACRGEGDEVFMDPEWGLVATVDEEA
jgi:hypothetical protein